MESPSAGTVTLAGRAIGSERRRRDGSIERVYAERELTGVRQRVGMVFQQFNLFPHMTAVGNVMEALRTVRGVGEIGRASCRERVCQYVKISEVAVSLKKNIIGHRSR